MKRTQNASGPECPECESRRTYVRITGYTDEGYRLRRRQCLDCDGDSFLTAEVILPGATWGELDTSARVLAQESYRRRRTATGPFRSRPYLLKPTARLDVHVTIRRVGHSVTESGGSREGSLVVRHSSPDPLPVLSRKIRV